MIIKDNGVIGVVGLGMMGASIVSALLINGQKVIALAPIESDLDKSAKERIKKSLNECRTQGITADDPEELYNNVTFTSSFDDLKFCWIIMESVSENLEIKKRVLEKIEKAVDDSVIITSNTSAIPISTLQGYLKVPERFFGMHWAEPAYTTRFLEIVCGDKSPTKIGKELHQIATAWGKEPTLVLKDIQGFITNRLMYSLYREAFYLVENGYATIDDVDRACKNDAGHWLTFCGPFRYMDLTGLQAYHAVMKNLFKDLSTGTEVPKLIRDIAESGGNGVSNGKGFYSYTPEESKAWELAFEKFAFDVNRLSTKYLEETDSITSGTSKD
ncbi:3-hydroxyacyl-CoA dehydrogenase family protein [Arenibacter sp. F26102]|uniref:3-hydroxyacyl-CoA dehydrogenase family protein n=1 Tax=Arenibacter sp. F26102 TaxID=2926416 RepID=UPI001FF3CC80|nr:3-hydroxyacyl-CoA dehydrogenase family protein [Arenibacter sp. F26102]MCK0148036.1 3-hydroxyacyl-CoA dehydrogenase family protein [Arenibacter sp. F26102]